MHQRQLKVQYYFYFPFFCLTSCLACTNIWKCSVNKNCLCLALVFPSRLTCCLLSPWCTSFFNSPIILSPAAYRRQYTQLGFHYLLLDSCRECPLIMSHCGWYQRVEMAASLTMSNSISEDFTVQYSLPAASLIFSLLNSQLHVPAPLSAITPLCQTS